jgi:hypothetical protein
MFYPNSVAAAPDSIIYVECDVFAARLAPHVGSS